MKRQIVGQDKPCGLRGSGIPLARVAAVTLALVVASTFVGSPAWAQESTSADAEVVSQESLAKSAEVTSEGDAADSAVATGTTEGSDETGTTDGTESSGATDTTEGMGETGTTDATGETESSATTDGTSTTDGTDAAAATTDGTPADGITSSTTTSTTTSATDVMLTATPNADATETLDGIDIASYQAGIDISKLTTTDFVIVKATQGTTYTNPTYTADADATLSSGKLLGFYHFAVGTSSATDEANFFVSAVNAYLGKAILCLDWEDSNSTNALSQGPSYAKSFLDEVYTLTGVRCLIYMSKFVVNEYDWSSVSTDYGLWVSQYGNNSEFHDYQTQDEIWTDSSGYGSWESPTMFQYSDNTYLDGYSGTLDVNMFYGSASDWEDLASANRWVTNDDGTINFYTSATDKVTSSWKCLYYSPTGAYGLERYWLDVDGILAQDRLVNPTTTQDAGAGYYAYALKDGTILRGVSTVTSDSETHLYLADNDGRLADGADGGWVITSEYGQGLQRYYIDATGRYAMTGFFSADGKRYYGIPSTGYELRGLANVSGGLRYANNDGELAGSQTGDWFVSDVFGQGLQRYWCVDGLRTTSSYLSASEAGYDAWATSEGYVLRGLGRDSSGTLIWADNDGRLASGWLVTSDFGQGLQRYWCKRGAVVTGLIDAGDGWWAYGTDAGYVVRGVYVTDGLVYLADNDGRLAGDDACGWVVSSAYGQGTQRYWVDPETHACKPGLVDSTKVSSGYSAWTLPEGYVLRGDAICSDGGMRSADNDGRLASGWLVTSAFGQGLQRYWLGSSDYAAVTDQLISAAEAGYNAYATSAGYVVRGVYVASNGHVYVANNDGSLGGGLTGWVVSSDFGQGLQRYWIDADGLFATTGYFSVDGKKFYGIPGEGFVLRGTMSVDGNDVVADNEGVILNA